MSAQLVSIPASDARIEGVLDVPAGAHGVVIFSHGSGSGRHSPRNQFVAGVLRDQGMGTLLVDLLTPEEDQTYANRFDIDLLTERLQHAVRFIGGHHLTADMPVGLFGASTGAASALRVAAQMPQAVRAVVSRGGRPDLTGPRLLNKVQAPTLLIVGGRDAGVIGLNESARDALVHCEVSLIIVPGATHLFEEHGALDKVALLAGEWFALHFAKEPPA